ncbi:DUF2634 domain-containing protein [Clostridium minihomine]|uniref:DUF2634 domain-containing protein n=1 Tax=Clostridium minihomine TaxID=2045012 RepID=UPI000C76F019|nr:DUF2634 domain-containing protein [Clostridium minihomine]
MSVLKTYPADSPVFSIPSLTWKIRGNRLQGMIDGKQAAAQAIELTLLTERFEHVTFSNDYGVEFAELVGKDREYVRADLKRRIAEALEQDDRVMELSDFQIEFKGEKAIVTVTVQTEFGDIPLERSVQIG